MQNFFSKQGGSDGTLRLGGKPAAPAVPVAQPWIEKYRPKNMSEVSSQEEAVQVLKRTIESQNLPHLLFYGPPGTGKTSTILALAKELYGPELFKTRILELNASDERGINVIREKVKNFARTTISQPVSGFPCPPYKIIILDEADSMTADAQSALRRTMETYSKITRFCLVCNYVSRIIEPLASRCAKFRFKPVDVDSMKSRLSSIAEKENINCPLESIDALIKVSEGDLRKAIMFLQTASKLHRTPKLSDDGAMEVDDVAPAAENPAIDPQTFVEIAGVVPDEIIERVFGALVDPKPSYEKIELVVNETVWSGYSAAQILSQLVDRIVADEQLSSQKKAMMCQKLGGVDKCLTDGSDEYLQLLSMMNQLTEVAAR